MQSSIAGVPVPTAVAPAPGVPAAPADRPGGGELPGRAPSTTRPAIKMMVPATGAIRAATKRDVTLLRWRWDLGVGMRIAGAAPAATMRAGGGGSPAT